MDMISAHKKRLAILRGGSPNTHVLSMKQGSELIALLHGSGAFDIVDIMVTSDNEWLVQGFVKQPEEVLASTDLGLLALLGSYGESGSIQRIFKRYGVPLVGSPAFQSALCLNKVLTKEHLKKNGVRQAPHLRLTRAGISDLQKTATTVVDLVGHDFIIKPTSGGLGLGVVTGSGAVELASLARECLNTYNDILVERYIAGTVVTCGIIDGLRGQVLYATPAVSIETKGDDSFAIETAEFLVPAEISREAKRNIDEYSKKIHTSLELSDISRSDFIVTDDDTIYFLETNTLPSLSVNGPLMAGLTAFGVGQDELMLHLLS